MRISNWSSDGCSSDRAALFRRAAIIAIAAAGSTAIVGVAWLALKPATLNLVAADDDRPQLPAKAPADALAGAPTSYGDVPPPGAPLPGHLGRPILPPPLGIATWRVGVLQDR